MRMRLLTSSVLAGAFTFGAIVESTSAEYVNSRASDDAISIYSSGIDGWLVDEKDAALRTALHMLSTRLSELPDEIGDPSMPPGEVFQMAADMLMGGMSLRAGMFDGDARGGPPIRAQLAFAAANAQEARQRGDMIFDMIRQAAGEPGSLRSHDQFPNVRIVEEENAPTIYLGSMNVGNRPVTVGAINALSADALNLSGYGLPQGATVAFAFDYDGSQVAPFLEMMLEQAPPREADMARAQLQMFGIIGESPLSMKMAWGHGADESHLAGLLENYVSNETYGMLLSEHPLSKREIDMIPSDATVARVGHMKMNAFGDYMIKMFSSMPADDFGGPSPAEMFDEIERETGINPKTDIFDHLGETWGYFMSDTTGGGGLLSTVAFAQVANPDELKNTFEQLTSMINDMAAQRANGYVRFRERTLGGHQVVTLSFPGLPIPLEISCAMSGGYLFAGATPQALVGALDHVANGGDGLTSNPRFAAMAGTNLAKAIDVEWQDTPRLIAGGYGLMSMALSALSNGVASPAHPERDAGLLMPSYAELAADAKPMLGMTWIDGDNIRFHYRMDQSMLVNLTGSLGALGGGSGAILVAALGAGVVMPAMSQARMTARTVKSSTQLRQLYMAAEVYAANEGTYPAGFDALRDDGYIVDHLEESPLGPCSDGGADYWFDFSGPHEHNPSRIIGYDRAAFADYGEVPVLFADGRGELLSPWDFEQRIREEPNAGVDFDLPWN